MFKKLLISSLVILSIQANAVDYIDSTIKGVGMMAGNDYIRFTIHQDPNAIFLTKQFTGESHKAIVSLILTAYASGKTVKFIRSDATTTKDTLHYTDLLTFEIESITHD